MLPLLSSTVYEINVHYYSIQYVKMEISGDGNMFWLLAALSATA